MVRLCEYVENLGHVTTTLELSCVILATVRFLFYKNDNATAMKKEETASFVLRFTQKIYEGEEGEPQVQWRGNIRHVQGGAEQRFSEFEDAITFIQEKLADLTLSATVDKTPEEQKGILAKSFDLWQQITVETPKIVYETIKDPRKGVEQIQSQISQVGDVIGQRVEQTLSQLPDIDYLRSKPKEEMQTISQQLEEIQQSLQLLHQKMEAKENSAS